MKNGKTIFFRIGPHTTVLLGLPRRLQVMFISAAQLSDPEKLAGMLRNGPGSIRTSVEFPAKSTELPRKGKAKRAVHCRLGLELFQATGPTRCPCLGNPDGR